MFLLFHVFIFTINWSDFTDLIPTLAIVAIIPFADSVADGAGVGFIMYITNVSGNVCDT